MSDAPDAPTTAEPAAAPAPASDPQDAALAELKAAWDADETAKAAQHDEPAPEPVAEVAPSEPANDEPAAEESKSDEPEAIWAAVARKRDVPPHQQPPPEPAAQQQPQTTAQLEAMVEQRILAEFERDPVAYYEKRGLDPRTGVKRFTEIAIDADKAELANQVKSTNDRLERWEQQQRERAEHEQLQAQQQAAQQAHDAAKNEYREISGSAEAYPVQSRLEPEQRTMLGVMFANYLGHHGVPYDNAKVAGMVEKTLADIVASAKAEPTEAVPAAKKRTTTVTATEAATTAAPRSLESIEDRAEAAAEQLRKDLSLTG